jgi:hypothetical protein
MAATVRHGVAQGCRRQCGRGCGALATVALTPRRVGRQARQGDVRCPGGVRTEERGQAASDGAAAASVRRLAGNGGVCAG